MYNDIYNYIQEKNVLRKKGLGFLSFLETQNIFFPPTYHLKIFSP